MPLPAIDTSKMDFGPGTVHFGGAYLGRTNGETQFSYSVDTFNIETEEDGIVDEIVTSDELTVQVPLLYTDAISLGLVIPWAKVITSASGDVKLTVGKAIGRRLSDYAKRLVVHPTSKDGDSEDTDDKSRDIVIYKCYPKPGPMTMTYSRQGQRIVTVTFMAMPEETRPNSDNYFCIGDPDIVAEAEPPTVLSTTPAIDANNVSSEVGTKFTFNMSEAMDETTVKKANTSIKTTTDDLAFTGYSVSYDYTNKAIVLELTSAMVASTGYIITLTTSIKDASGNSLASAYTLSFTTAA